MKLKMIETIKAASCPLGIKTKEYKKDETYEIFDNLAQIFLAEGWASKEGEEKAMKVVLENKAIEKSPEDKSINKVEEKKESDSKPVAKKKRNKK